MNPADALLVGGAGFLAGAVNAVAGGGTLITFPVLLAIGLPAITANTTSAVGLLAGYASGSVAYRHELAGQGPRIRGVLVAALLGGIVGAFLLLLTPGSFFRVFVPALVLLSCGLLAVQPLLASRLAVRQGKDHSWSVRVAVGLAAVYGAYFGGGLGVLLLAVLGLLIADGLQRLNALKVLLSLVINVVSALLFIVTGNVDWAAAGLLAVGALLGAVVGVRVARRLPPTLIRTAVVVLGIVVAVVLIVRP